VASPLTPALQAAASYDEERELDPHSAASASHLPSHVDEETPDLSPKDLLELPIFWHLTSCFVTTTVGGMYVAGTFKTFGQEFFQNESFLAQVSSVSAIFNAVGRIAWGSLADRFLGRYILTI
jgi:nitrate/nitrite transporter NarK